MTAERALELSMKLGSMMPERFYPHIQDITKEERKEVNAFWKTMPGNTCFIDALNRIYTQGGINQ